MHMSIDSSFFFNDTAATEIYTYLHTHSLHDALPIITTVLTPPPSKACQLRGGIRQRPLASPSTHSRRTRRSNASNPTRSRSEEHTSELQSLMRSSYAVFCLKKKQLVISHLNLSQNHINKINNQTKHVCTSNYV